MRAVQSARRLALTVLALCLAAAPAAAHEGFHGGGGFGGGFHRGFVVRPFFFGGFYDPWFWGPYEYGPYWGYGYSEHAGMGKVKIETQLKDAEVYVDGAYAGTTSHTKDMWLRSGAHNIEIRAPGHPKYALHVYVLGGKTLKISPGF